MEHNIEVFIHAASKEKLSNFLRSFNVSDHRVCAGVIVKIEITDGKPTYAGMWRPYVSRVKQFSNELRTNASLSQPTMPEDRPVTDAISIDEFINNFYAGAYE